MIVSIENESKSFKIDCAKVSFKLIIIIFKIKISLDFFFFVINISCSSISSKTFLLPNQLWHDTNLESLPLSKTENGFLTEKNPNCNNFVDRKQSIRNDRGCLIWGERSKRKKVRKEKEQWYN